MYFDVYKNPTSRLYWWAAKGNNHETLCHSEMLSSKQACFSAIKVIMAGAAGANVYDETGEAAGDVKARRVRT